jgi:2-methylcitrate dehydratase PrpD
MDQSLEFGCFVAASRVEDFPASVVAAGKRGLLDCLGCALFGSRSRAVVIVQNLIEETVGKFRAGLIGGNGKRASVPGAVLFNGTAAHALDFDDTLTAPTAVVALALAEVHKFSGRELMAAYILGSEVASRMAHGFGGWENERGWHMMGVAGGFGAAAAAGYLLRLNAEQISHALNIAATQAAGLVAMHGFLAKPFHSGRAAQNGYYAAELALHGCTAGPALDGPRSVFHAMGAAQSPALAEDLGRSWMILKSRLKPFPCGRLGHAAIEAALKARALKEFRLKEVSSVQIRVNPRAQYLMGEPEPKNGTEAMFSIGHGAAAALVYGRLGPEHFTDEAVRDPAIAAGRRQTIVVPDEQMKAGQAAVEIETTSGRRLRAEVPIQKGFADNPLTDSDVREKFLDLAKTIIEPEQARQAADLVAALEQVDDAGEIARLCC